MVVGGAKPLTESQPNYGYGYFVVFVPWFKFGLAFQTKARQ